MRAVEDEDDGLARTPTLEAKVERGIEDMRAVGEAPACDMATPTLSALEWAQKPEKLRLSAKSVVRIRQLAEASARPSARLREAARRHAR